MLTPTSVRRSSGVSDAISMTPLRRPPYSAGNPPVSTSTEPITSASSMLNALKRSFT